MRVYKAKSLVWEDETATACVGTLTLYWGEKTKKGRYELWSDDGLIGTYESPEAMRSACEAHHQAWWLEMSEEVTGIMAVQEKNLRAILDDLLGMNCNDYTEEELALFRSMEIDGSADLSAIMWIIYGMAVAADYSGQTVAVPVEPTNEMVTAARAEMCKGWADGRSDRTCMENALRRSIQAAKEEG